MNSRKLHLDNLNYAELERLMYIYDVVRRSNKRYIMDELRDKMDVDETIAVDYAVNYNLLYLVKFSVITVVLGILFLILFFHYRNPAILLLFSGIELLFMRYPPILLCRLIGLKRAKKFVEISGVITVFISVLLLFLLSYWQKMQF